MTLSERALSERAKSRSDKKQGLLYYVARNTSQLAARMEGYVNNSVGGADSTRKEPTPILRGLPRGWVHFINIG